MKRRMWTLQIEVTDNWIADGFDFDGDRCHELQESLIPYAHEGEVTVKVVGRPDPTVIRQLQDGTIAVD
jgi:hypothetical protein